MAIYEFICNEHLVTTEVSAKIADFPLVAPLCPKCQRSMDRKYTAPGIEFKGDGWAGKS